MNLITDFRFAVRSLSRVKGLTITVVLTLALGIGANAAIFSVVRGVLLRPLANRGEDRLVYIRQSAPGIGSANAVFSVPEMQDLRGRVKTLTSFGDFSTIAFTMVGLGEPRVVSAGVETHGLSNHGPVALERRGPETMRQHRGASRVRPVIGRGQQPAQYGAEASSATCPPSSRWSGHRRSRMCGRRCLRRTA